ncbi:hypothetical protein K438DRAFT_1940076 [Mycena galopus ATCC 62051]|nr:hypothetical protein K438DRAFT_1940076 [Mycena galopus ATCC 62051]
MAPGFAALSWTQDEGHLYQWFIRLYFQGTDLGVYEMTFSTNQGWAKSNKGNPIFTARRDTPLATVISKHHTHHSVFYIDADGYLRECRFEGGRWGGLGKLPAFDMSDTTNLAPVDMGPPGIETLGFRLYYQKKDNTIQELKTDVNGLWWNGKNFDNAVKNTSLAALNAGELEGTGDPNRLHLFYCKTNGYLDHWSTSSGDWKAEQLSWAPKANSGLAGVTWDNSGSEYELRVYFSESSGTVQELKWVSQGRWSESITIPSGKTLTPAGKPLGSVTSYGPYGRITSVFMNCGDNTVEEMCYEQPDWDPLANISWDRLKDGK